MTAQAGDGGLGVSQYLVVCECSVKALALLVCLGVLSQKHKNNADTAPEKNEDTTAHFFFVSFISQFTGVCQ